MANYAESIKSTELDYEPSIIEPEIIVDDTSNDSMSWLNDLSEDDDDNIKVCNKNF